MQTARQQIPERKDYQQPPGTSHPHQGHSQHAMFPPAEVDVNADGCDQPTEMSSNPFRNAGGWSNDDHEGDYKTEYQSTSLNEYDGRYQQTDGFRCVPKFHKNDAVTQCYLIIFQAGQHCLGGQLICLRG